MPPVQQQGWTPNQQQGWSPPTQQSWQSGQGWAPPTQGWPPSQTWQPYWQQTPTYQSSALVTIAAVCILVAGALFTLFGLLLLILGAAGSAFLSDFDPSFGEFGAAVAAVVITVSAILLVIGILEIAAAIGIFVHKTWARWTGIVLGVIGVLLGFLMLIAAFEPPSDGGFAIFAVIWLAAHGFAVAALAAGGEHFQPRFFGR
jgi:hypothetical protein